MSQQTLINNYYKSVNPKHNQLSKNKSETITSKFSDKQHPTKKKSLSLGNRKKEAPPAVSPTKSPKKNRNLSRNNSTLDINDLLIIDEGESDITNNGIKTTKLSRDVSFAGNSHVSTPNSGEKNRKRSLSGSKNSGSPSPKKKNQTSGSRSVTKHLKHRTSRRLFHNEAIDAGKVSDMIENLNLSRVGVIPKNNYDLDKLYSQINDEAEIVDCDIDEITPSYDVNRVVIPREKHAEHLFDIITQVFSNPSNCGYFNDEELDLVFNILSLSEKSQMLLARMIKRKYCWRRSSSVEYPEIGQDLRQYFDELEKQKLIIISNLDTESLETMLMMLTANELYDICKQSKIPRQSNKDLAVKKLLKTSCIKPLFPGMESPAAKLRKTISTALDHCVCLPKAVISLVDRIVTLFTPAEDVSTRISDIFLKLTMTKEGTLRFPEVPIPSQHYPVFQNREHLLRYVKRKNEWRQAMEMPKSVRENWEIFKRLGRKAHSRFMWLLAKNGSSQKNTSVPRHIEKFREEYVCIKIVMNCLEIFKKEDSTVGDAVHMLKNLIAQQMYLQSRKAEWYEELALIEMKHKRNPEAAALVTIEGLSLHNITETGKHLLTKRATTLAKRRDGIKVEIKTRLQSLLGKETFGNTVKVSINASVMEGNHPGRKSVWSIDIGSGDKGYMSVEYRAKYYYSNNGYPRGWHCEGALPVTLFTLLFWEEIYHVDVPAAYLSAYQKAPLDLYTSDFYNNRKQQIDDRVEILNSLSADELANLIEESLQIRQHYECLMPTKLAVDSEQLRDIVRCMGTSVVVGICQRLVSNFSGWRAGFPDLLVWNPDTLKCKFVEVKGPGDTLSAKQTLWLRYLENIGAVTELCEVKAK